MAFRPVVPQTFHAPKIKVPGLSNPLNKIGIGAAPKVGVKLPNFGQQPSANPFGGGQQFASPAMPKQLGNPKNLFPPRLPEPEQAIHPQDRLRKILFQAILGRRL